MLRRFGSAAGFSVERGGSLESAFAELRFPPHEGWEATPIPGAPRQRPRNYWKGHPEQIYAALIEYDETFPRSVRRGARHYTSNRRPGWPTINVLQKEFPARRS